MIEKTPSKKYLGGGNRFEVKVPIAKNCDWSPATPSVSIAEGVYRRILSMMTRMKSSEWLAYLIGFEENGSISVADIYVPEQEATSGSAESLEMPPEGSIGIIHSHHSMGSFFSSTDQDSANTNNRLSVVISKDGMKANVRTPLPCGMQRHAEADVKILYEYDTAWADEAAAKVKEPVYAGRFIAAPAVRPYERELESEKDVTTSHRRSSRRARRRARADDELLDWYAGYS